MHERRLEEIKARLEGHDSEAYHDASDMAVGFGEVVSEALDLVEEVERLRGRLEAVCGVLSDADAFDGVVHQEKVMDAVRGYRQATMEEAKAKLSGSAVDDDVLLKWIIDWKITVHADGKLVIDDLTGLAYAMMGGSAWRLN